MHSSQLGAGARYTGVGALILVAGCATHTAPRPIWEGTPDDSDQQITLRISNHLWNDVVVYSFASGARVRLGMVTTGIPKRFRIPTHHRFAPKLEFLADPIGSPQVRRSGPVVAVPGQEVTWTIHQTAGISTLVGAHSLGASAKKSKLLKGRTGAEIQHQVIRFERPQLPEQTTLLLIRNVGHEGAASIAGDKLKPRNTRTTSNSSSSALRALR